MHKLSTGSGYDYLTRQVAVQDSTEKGHQGLTTYYSEHGETPGVWVGRGCAGIGEGFAGSQVTAEQMQLLFGAGQHPLGHERADALGPNASEKELLAAYSLGSAFQLGAEVSGFRVEVARRVQEWNHAHGQAADARVPTDVRAQIRSAVAREFFVREMGRSPVDARELAGAIARYSRPGRSVVAGFDLTFSPPKSVSTLWAIAELPLSAKVEQAHHEAVADALAYVEDQLLYTREGARGVRQVDVDGLVGAAFTHRDSRAGDPDLHTHVAVANKVRATGSGKWLAIDARLLYQGIVAASETYNTSLYKRLEALGLSFEDRQMGAGKRPVREIAGIPAELNQRWSSRRRAIEQRRGELASTFQGDHGRPPTTVEGYSLAQQATLETRDAKHAPRTITEQRTAWHAEALDILGTEHALQQVLTSVFHPQESPRMADAAWFDAAADRVVAAMEARGATWRQTDVRAEAHRQVRRTSTPTHRVEAAVSLLTSMALDRSVAMPPPDFGITEPAELQRADGASVYTVAGSLLHTSTKILDAEQRLVDLAGRTNGHAVPGHALDQSLKASEAQRGFPLNAGQDALVRDLAGSGRMVQLAIAPAGSGKTTAMHALALAWEATGHTVIGLAPSAAAAAQLADATSTTTDTLAKLAWGITHQQLPDWATHVTAGSLVIIDEAGMADTLTLDAVVGWATGRGAVVRLVGDDQQLSAIGAGGLLRDIQTRHGAASLTELMRFTDPAEAAASLALRAGDPAALGFYLDQDRIHVGDLATVTSDAFAAWTHDVAAGRDAIMLAPTRDVVADLNHRARTHRLTTTTSPGGEVTLSDGNQASIGDVVITRRNDRRLRTSRTDWVKNGDRWTITALARDGGVEVKHQRSGRLVSLPHGYVTEAVELGYASTIHAAQGLSADVMHGVATSDQTRQQLYTMMTRGRDANHLWLQTTGDGDAALLTQPAGITPPTPTEILEQILARDDAPRSATTHHTDQHQPAALLGDAVAAYVDGISTAAELHYGTTNTTRLETVADQLHPGLVDAPAWPALRARLLLAAADGHNPEHALAAAYHARPVGDADDIAAVILWRLGPTPTRGPLPWTPAVPAALAAHPVWGTWLRQRGRLVDDLATQVRRTTPATPAWAPDGCSPALVADLAVWRAAHQIPDTDLRPAGPRPTTPAELAYQQHLLSQLTASSPALDTWRPVLEAIGERLLHDPAAPRLAERLTHLAHAGHDVHGLLADTITTKALPDDHPAAALYWRLTTATLDEASASASPAVDSAVVPEPEWQGPTPEARLALAAMIRDTQGPLPLTDAELRHQMDRADALAGSPVSRERLLQVNQLAHDYYTSCFPHSWARPYLHDRMGVDLTNHPAVQPGYAPAGWTHLVNHLRRHGVTDLEMTTAGLAKPSRNGNLIDRFRDRLTLPITTPDGEIFGFVARANPTLPPDQTGPKYLNTPTTPLFCKGDQFYGHPRPDTIPVIVEGPLDALAITLATGGRYTGLAPMGTSLTTQQARLLANADQVIVATDADPAGNTAAERDHYQLAPHNVPTRRAVLPEGTDPAELLVTQGSVALTRALDDAPDLGTQLLQAALDNDPHDIDCACAILATCPSDQWTSGITTIAVANPASAEQITTCLNDLLALPPEQLVLRIASSSQDPRPKGKVPPSRIPERHQEQSPRRATGQPTMEARTHR